MRRNLLLLVSIGFALAVPASASAATVIVTPTPSSLPAPGGIFQYTVNVNPAPTVAFTPATGSYSEPTVSRLTDSVYGDLAGKGTCAASFSSPQSLPYACTFPGEFKGLAGASQTNTVTAEYTAILSPPGPFPTPGPISLSASGSATVSLTKAKCKKGFKLKTVKTKSGKKKKCVKKKK